MSVYRVWVHSKDYSHSEEWEADSKEEAERKSRERWERTFANGSGYHFIAEPDNRADYIRKADLERYAGAQDTL